MEYIERTITLYKAEVLYDVDNITNRIGLARTDGSGARQTALLQTDTSTNTRAMINRAYALAMAEIRAKLSAYIYITDVSTEGNDKLDSVSSTVAATANTVIVLHLPTTWEQANFDSIVLYLHNFLVYRTIYEYMRIVNPNEAVMYFNLANDAIDHAKWGCDARVFGAVKKPLNPF